ncbi:MAG: PEFG-CTERM sorting domain-containing protein [Nitrosopumilus sp.]
MKSIVLLLSFATLLFVPFSPDAFGQESYDILIPTGSASSDAPYFWQSEKDGSTSGNIEIITGDTIVWKNADTTRHTVTSGSAAEGPNDLFDSGLFAPGKSYTRTFSDVGNYPYFCLVHPWMDGTVMVTSGYSIIPQVGKQVGDGETFFDVEYAFNRLLSEVTIDEGQKSITFEIIGNAKSDNNMLELRVPSELIYGPFVIWVDDENVEDFENTQDGSVNVLSLQIGDNSKTLTIIGTSIVPEFGSIVMLILAVSIVSMIILSQKFSSKSYFNFQSNIP